MVEMAAARESSGDGEEAAVAMAVDVADPGSLRRARKVVVTMAEDAGLAPSRADDLLVAVNEVLTNSLRHGGGHGDLLAWTATGWLVCQVEDAGRLPVPVTDPKPPPAGATRGRGLWMVSQLVDLLQIRSVPAGTSIRVLMRLTPV